MPRTLDQSCILIRALGRLQTTRSDGRADGFDWLATIADPSMTAIRSVFDEAYPVTMARYGDLLPDAMKECGPRATPPTRDDLLHQLRGLGLLLSTLGAVTQSKIDPADVGGEELFVPMWQRGVAFAERLDLSPALP